jgi:1-acyl-sn-glycerol-3-phosphate acyltransferase
VLIFPEGSRTPDGAMRAFKPGIQLLVKRARVPLVPVGIAGAYHAWPIWRKYPIPAPLFCPAAPGCIAVVVGEPFDSARLAELPRDQALQELYGRIHDVQIQAEKLRR